jgi:hypothetical protein
LPSVHPCGLASSVSTADVGIGPALLRELLSKGHRQLRGSWRRVADSPYSLAALTSLVSKPRPSGEYGTKPVPRSRHVMPSSYARRIVAMLSSSLPPGP